jgi:hypothetical protein
MPDWMHDTARCLGYPSDSSRAARECARETSCGRHPRRPVRLGRVGYFPLCLRSWPVRLLSWPVWLRSLPVWLASLALCPCGLPLSSGRRRALLTSHWPWVVCRAARRRAGSPARIATVVFAGVQWGGLGLTRLRVDRRQRRIV